MFVVFLYLIATVIPGRDSDPYIILASGPLAHCAHTAHRPDTGAHECSSHKCGHWTWSSISGVTWCLYGYRIDSALVWTHPSMYSVKLFQEPSASTATHTARPSSPRQQAAQTFGTRLHPDIGARRRALPHTGWFPTVEPHEDTCFDMHRPSYRTT